MSALTQADIGELLERAGAHPPRHGRGKWRCPDCDKPALSVDLDRQVFNCHHTGCEFRGGIGTLKKRLGIAREWIPKPEYIRQRKAREQAESQARAFLAECRGERLKVYGELRELAGLETLAHDAGPDHPATWDALALVYGQRPRLQAEAVLLSEGAIAGRLAWLEGNAGERERIIDGILMAGGVTDDTGKFVEVGA